MFEWFKNLIQEKPETEVARKLYAGIVAQARQQVFYSRWQVADTVDGRFDMIAVHLFLLLKRLKDESEMKPMVQELVNLVVTDMDSSLREMGASDMSVGKKVQKMARALYGRLEAYQDAYDQADNQMLMAVINRNVFRSEAGPDEMAMYIAEYMRAQTEFLEQQPSHEFAKGVVAFNEVR